MGVLPKVSIIVPVYKAAGYLPQCIESIIKQNDLNFELLLIDDGSPDESGEICDEYSKKDARIRVFQKTNGGVSSARNLGLDNARGEWVFFVDADDYLESEALFIIFDKINHYNDIDVFCFDNHFRDDSEQIVSVKTTHSEELIQADDNIKKMLLCLINSNPWGKLYKHYILSDYRFNESVHVGEDLLFHLTVLLNNPAIRILNCREFFYHYRIWGGSAMAKFDHNFELLRDEINLVLTNTRTFNSLELEYHAFVFINMFNKVVKQHHGVFSKESYKQFLPIISSAFKVKKDLKFKHRMAVTLYRINRHVGNTYSSLFYILKSTINK